jgi:Tfp pilus assembly protein FimT
MHSPVSRERRGPAASDEDLPLACALQLSRNVGDSRGISLIEVLVVLGLIAVMAGIAIPVTAGMIARQRAESAVVSTMTVLQAARNRAVAERRNIQVDFELPNRIVIQRIEVPGPAVTVLEEVLLDNGQTFQKFTGLPDTPDSFGAASEINFTGPAPVMFTSEGSLVDDNGDVVNATLLLGIDNDLATARAVTIFGVTGYMRSWKWGGSQWVQ